MCQCIIIFLSFLFIVNCIVCWYFCNINFVKKKVTYFAKTERHVNVRSSEHLVISNLAGKRLKCKPSAVSDHLLLYNHDSDYYPMSRNNGFRLLLYKRIYLNI